MILRIPSVLAACVSHLHQVLTFEVGYKLYPTLIKCFVTGTHLLDILFDELSVPVRHQQPKDTILLRRSAKLFGYCGH